MTRPRSLIPVGVTAAAAVLAVGLAAPVAAQGVIGTGSGRAGAIVAMLVGLIGVVAGWLAVAGRSVAGDGRDGAVVAQVLGLVGIGLAALHLATSTGGIGTGNGRLGAIVALVLGVIGMVLGRLALARSHRTG